MGYQHSKVFSSLKTIKDSEQNLTSFQWLSTLDYFIESALDPIATSYPLLLDNYYAKVIAYQAIRPSVKFSRNPKDVLPTMLFNSLTTAGVTKRAHQKKMLLNRGLLFGLMKIFHQTLNNYKKLHNPLTKISASDRRLLIKLADDRVGGSPFLFASLIQSEYWSAKAYHFKELIIQKYVRLAIMSAQRTYVDSSHLIKLDDVIQTYLIYLSRAVDRCDSRQGVLTTFIQTWFYSARSEVHRRVKEECHSSYEELVESGEMLTHAMPDTSAETVQHISYVAKSLDPNGAVRYSLGIPEYFTRAQVKQLQLFSKPTTN